MTSQLTEEEVGRLANLREKKRELQCLLKDRAFGRVVAGLQEEADALQQSVVFTPLRSLDGALAVEFQKGKIAGLLEITAFISGQLEALEFDLRNILGDTYDDTNEPGDFRASP